MKTKPCPRGLFIGIVTLSLFARMAAGAEATNGIVLVTPGASWSLEINAPGFQVQKNAFSPDGMSAQLMAENQQSGIILSAFLEKAASPGDAKACRDYYWNKAKQSPMKKDDVTLSETGQVALVEYLIKDMEGVPLNQKNLNAYLSTNGYWVDVHLSKTDFKPEDEAAFQTLVKSIRVNGDFVTTPIACATWGSFYIAQGNFAMALHCSERALELDKTHPGLTHAQRVMVLEDVINCYGNLGNNPKAKELSELGLKQEPDYPQFYYSLACSYAETGDKDHALEYLKKAFANRPKLLPGDPIADPRTDSSFTRYSTDPDFVKFYAETYK